VARAAARAARVDGKFADLNPMTRALVPALSFLHRRFYIVVFAMPFFCCYFSVVVFCIVVLTHAFCGLAGYQYWRKPREYPHPWPFPILLPELGAAARRCLLRW
jgi:hypothetical protein